MCFQPVTDPQLEMNVKKGAFAGKFFGGKQNKNNRVGNH